MDMDVWVDKIEVIAGSKQNSLEKDRHALMNCVYS